MASLNKRLKTEEGQQSEANTELATEISSIADLDGNHFQKGKHLFHQRMLKNNYIPTSPGLLGKLSSNSYETVFYKDEVHDQEIKVKFYFLRDITVVTFLRPSSTTAAGLYISKKQMDSFNSYKNPDKIPEILKHLIKKIDTMIFKTQNAEFMTKHHKIDNETESEGEE